MAYAETSTGVIVLVADGDSEMRHHASNCLQGFGPIDDLEAVDGLEALRLARAVQADRVTSNVAMPGLDGVALCRILKADVYTHSTPILLVTGEERASLPCGDAVLAKPFDAADLRANVDPLLRESV